MFNEIDVQGNEIDCLLDDLRETLQRINNFNKEERRSRLRRCGDIVQQLKTVRAAYVLELKSMEDEEARARYSEALKEKNNTCHNLVTNLRAKQNEIDREQLNEEANEMDVNDCQQMTTQKLIAHGDKIQDKTQEAVDRMKQQVAETEEIGTITANKMDQQIVQIGHISEGLNDVEYNLKRAKKTAATLSRNAATDKCIQLLCLLILVCIIIIIILIATKK